MISWFLGLLLSEMPLFHTVGTSIILMGNSLSVFCSFNVHFMSHTFFVALTQQKPLQALNPILRNDIDWKCGGNTFMEGNQNGKSSSLRRQTSFLDQNNFSLTKVSAASLQPCSTTYKYRLQREGMQYAVCRMMV